MLKLNLKRSLATRWTIGTENGLLLGFPSTAASGLAEDTGYAERICIELSVRPFSESKVGRDDARGDGRGRRGARFARESRGDGGG